MQTLNFTHKRGDTFEAVTFQINIDNVPMDLTGAIIRMQLRKEAGAPVVFTPTITLTDADGGQFLINKQIIDINACTYKYDIEIEEADGDVWTWISGLFTITNDITR